MFHRRKREVLSLQVNTERCSGCGECVDMCRRNVLDMEYGADYNVAKVVNLSNCVGCGKCWLKCPTNAIELVVEQNKLSFGCLR